MWCALVGGKKLLRRKDKGPGRRKLQCIVFPAETPVPLAHLQPPIPSTSLGSLESRTRRREKIKKKDRERPWPHQKKKSPCSGICVFWALLGREATPQDALSLCDLIARFPWKKYKRRFVVLKFHCSLRYNDPSLTRPLSLACKKLGCDDRDVCG